MVSPLNFYKEYYEMICFLIYIFLVPTFIVCSMCRFCFVFLQIAMSKVLFLISHRTVFAVLPSPAFICSFQICLYQDTAWQDPKIGPFRAPLPHPPMYTFHSRLLRHLTVKTWQFHQAEEDSIL